MKNQIFMNVFVESVRLKDAGLLKSSLEKRREATKLAMNDPGLYAIGKANEATLLGHHIGDGLSAYKATKEALSDAQSFAEADREWKSTTGFSLLFDCFGFVGQWSESYEEAIQYEEEADNWVSLPSPALRISQLRDNKKSGMKWWETQFAIAQNFYSRTRPEADAGKHATGMSILQCIIHRALKEQPGYEIDEEDLFNLLDDYLQLSLQAYNGILQKFVHASRYNSELQRVDGASEQFILFREPLDYWLQLMPDCPKKWKPTLQAHYERFMESPFPIYPETMKKIGAYFSDSRIETITCPYCHHNNTKASPICVNCRRPFGKTMPTISKGRIITSILFSFTLTAGFWYWAIHSGMKWYIVVIAVLNTIIVLGGLPKMILLLRN